MNVLNPPGSNRSHPPSDDQQPPPKRPHSVQQAPAIDPILDSRPIKSDVLWHLRPHLSAQWNDFSIYLRFESEQRDTIVKESHYQSDDCLTAVITQWLQERRGTGDLPRTWRALLHAVSNLGNKDIAGEVHRALAAGAASTGVSLSQPTPPPQPRPLQQQEEKEEEEGEVEGFLRPHYTSFLKDIDAQQVAMELNHRRLLPDSVRGRIEQALSREKANGCLYDHLRTGATLDSLDAVLSVMLSEHFQAYTRMYQLAKKLQEDLRELVWHGVEINCLSLPDVLALDRGCMLM